MKPRCSVGNLWRAPRGTTWRYWGPTAHRGHGEEEETEIYLGGLPFERPPGWRGPALTAGSYRSVTARDTDGRVMTASEFLPVSPGESAGYSCVPGTGAVTGG